MEQTILKNDAQRNIFEFLIRRRKESILFVRF